VTGACRTTLHPSVELASSIAADQHPSLVGSPTHPEVSQQLGCTWEVQLSREVPVAGSPLLAEVAKRYREILLSSNALKLAPSPSRPFKLRNGSYSPVYVDHSLLLCEPDSNKFLVEALESLVKQLFERHEPVLCNVDSKSSPHLAGAIATRCNYRQIVITHRSTYVAENGTMLRVRLPSVIEEGDPIVIVDDVLTPYDQTAIQVVELVRKALAERFGKNRVKHYPIHAIVALLRGGNEAPIELRSHDVQVHWLSSLEHILGGPDPTLDYHEARV
jgi:orotate phosphoribosyltransferase